jgi:hypothetical protein
MSRVKTDRLDCDSKRAAYAQNATNETADSEQAFAIDEFELTIEFVDGSEIVIDQ